MSIALHVFRLRESCAEKTRLNSACTLSWCVKAPVCTCSYAVTSSQQLTCQLHADCPQTLIKPLTDMRAAALLSHSPAAAAAVTDALHACALHLLTNATPQATASACGTAGQEAQEAHVALVLLSMPVHPGAMPAPHAGNFANLMQAVQSCGRCGECATLLKAAADFGAADCLDAHQVASAVSTSIQLLAASHGHRQSGAGELALAARWASLASATLQGILPALCQTDRHALQSVTCSIADVLLNRPAAEGEQPPCSAMACAHVVRVLAAHAADIAYQHAQAAVAAQGGELLGQWFGIHQLLHAGQASIQHACQLGLGVHPAT